MSSPAVARNDWESLWPSLAKQQNDQPKKRPLSKQRKRPQSKVDDDLRVEAAMQMIENAKQKAQQQKLEYSKILQRKVKLQREEQKQWEMEAEAQRAQAEAQLLQVLAEQKQRRRQEARQYYIPLPKPPAEGPASPTTAARGAGQREDPALAETHKSVIHFNMATEYDIQPGEMMSTQTRRGRHVDFQSTMDSTRDLTLEEVRLPFLEKALSLLMAQKPPEPPPVTQERPAERRRRHAEAHMKKVEGMLEKARSRKDHAMEVMMADPPADFLPSEVSTVHSEIYGNDLAFMTEVDAEPASPVLSVDSTWRIAKGRQYVHYNPHQELATLTRPVASSPKAWTLGAFLERAEQYERDSPVGSAKPRSRERNFGPTITLDMPD